MKKSTLTTEFRVTQVVGSMAVDGIRVSAETRSKMTRIINGEVNASDLRQELVQRYCKLVIQTIKFIAHPMTMCFGTLALNGLTSILVVSAQLTTSNNLSVARLLFSFNWRAIHERNQ